jgi:hypothetical protein
MGVLVADRVWELEYPERAASTVSVLRCWTVVSRTAAESWPKAEVAAHWARRMRKAKRVKWLVEVTL